VGERVDSLEWTKIHHYARTTIECRGRYLDYFIAFAGRTESMRPSK